MKLTHFHYFTKKKTLFSPVSLTVSCQVDDELDLFGFQTQNNQLDSKTSSG